MLETLIGSFSLASVASKRYYRKRRNHSMRWHRQQLASVQGETPQLRGAYLHGGGQCQPEKEYSRRKRPSHHVLPVNQVGNKYTYGIDIHKRHTQDRLIRATFLRAPFCFAMHSHLKIHSGRICQNMYPKVIPQQPKYISMPY